MNIFRNSSNMARIGAKLCQNAFRTIPDVSFVHAPKICPTKLLDQKFVFRLFGVDFEEPQPNGPQNQLPRQILLQIDVSRGLYVQKISDSFKFSDLRKVFTPVAGGRFPCGIKSTASYIMFDSVLKILTPKRHP